MCGFDIHGDAASVQKKQVIWDQGLDNDCFFAFIKI